MLRYCAITHKFGPFMGKVVDAQTGEPIKGAAVLICFGTESVSVGGTVGHNVDAVEAVTGAGGEFRIPPKRVNLFRLTQTWDEDCLISIFKPGYGAYPGHLKTFSSPGPKRSLYIPENKYITFYLPKLLTIMDRKKNLGNIKTYGGITNDKMPNLRKLESEERVFVGLKPFSDKIWRKTK